MQQFAAAVDKQCSGAVLGSERDRSCSISLSVGGVSSAQLCDLDQCGYTLVVVVVVMVVVDVCL